MKESWKRFMQLSPEQQLRVSEECLGTGPYKVLHVATVGRTATVTVQFKNGEKKKVTV